VRFRRSPENEARRASPPAAASDGDGRPGATGLPAFGVILPVSIAAAPVRRSVIASTGTVLINILHDPDADNEFFRSSGAR
jgi:hypothetical protein